MGYQLRVAESIEQLQTIIRYAEFLFDRRFPVVVDMSEVEPDEGWQHHAMHRIINEYGLFIDPKITMIISMHKLPKLCIRCYQNHGPIAIFVKEIFEDKLVSRTIHLGFKGESLRDHFLKTKGLELISMKSSS